MSLAWPNHSFRTVMVFRTVLNHRHALPFVRYQTTSSNPSNGNPLRPSTPTDHLGLPLHPLRATIPHITPTLISRETLHRLHRLSALDPPPADSDEETALMSGLGELVGLMDLVKEVELPSGDRNEMVRELLSEGVGEVVIDESDGEVSLADECTTAAVGEAKKGRELLEYATRRVGDYYAHRVERKKDPD